MLLNQLRVLNGYEIDLAVDVTRLRNRLGDALTSITRWSRWLSAQSLGHSGQALCGLGGRAPRR